MKWDYDTMDPTMVFHNRMIGILAAYQKAYPNLDFSETLTKKLKGRH